MPGPISPYSVRRIKGDMRTTKQRMSDVQPDLAHTWFLAQPQYKNFKQATDSEPHLLHPDLPQVEQDQLMARAKASLEK